MAASGYVSNNKALVMFLYFLLEEVPYGQIERALFKTHQQGSYFAVYPNGWQAQWADYIAEGLMRVADIPSDPQAEADPGDGS